MLQRVAAVGAVHTAILHEVHCVRCRLANPHTLVVVQLVRADHCDGHEECPHTYRRYDPCQLLICCRLLQKLCNTHTIPCHTTKTANIPTSTGITAL